MHPVPLHLRASRYEFRRGNETRGVIYDATRTRRIYLTLIIYAHQTYSLKLHGNLCFYTIFL